MNGLDRILNEISDDAKIAAEHILEEARRQSDRTVEIAKKNAEKIIEKARNTADAEYKKITDGAKSGAEVLEKRMILDAKQNIIGDIVNEAYKKLVNLSDGEYDKYIIRLLDKYAHDPGGTVIFSDRYKNGIPTNVKSAALKKGLNVSENLCEADGGFILKYGDIEENCLFKALFEEEHDKLHDAVNEFLF